MIALANFLHHGLSRLYRFCGAIGAAFLALIAVLVSVSIVARLASIYVPGMNRYTGYAMAAASFFALSYTFHAHGHIRVAMLLNAVGARTRKAFEIWCHAVAAAVTAFLAYYLVRMTWVSFDLGDVSDGADAWPLWIPQVPVALGSVVLAICVAHHLVLTVARPAGATIDSGPEV